MCLQNKESAEEPTPWTKHWRVWSLDTGLIRKRVGSHRKGRLKKSRGGGLTGEFFNPKQANHQGRSYCYDQSPCLR